MSRGHNYCALFPINGTTIIVWRSDEFIGTGGRDLELGVPDAYKNIPSTDYNTTVAQLYSVDPVRDIYNLKVNLTVRIHSDGNLLCMDDSNNVKRNVTILICK